MPRGQEGVADLPADLQRIHVGGEQDLLAAGVLQIALGLGDQLVRGAHLLEPGERHVVEDLGRALAAGGCTFADVLQVTIYLLDVADMARVDEVYRSYFKPPYPVRASLIVAGLVAPGMRIELNAVAAKSAA